MGEYITMMQLLISLREGNENEMGQDVVIYIIKQ